MDADRAWYAVLAWLLVAACTYAAFIFGRFSRASFDRFPRGHVPTRTRIGVAVSIVGPLVSILAGFIAASITGQWLIAATATFIAVVVIAGIGLYLAPH